MIDVAVSAAAPPLLTLLHTLPIRHGGSPAILGVNAEGHLAVEEVYDDWLAQYLFAPDGTLLACQDELGGANVADEAAITGDSYAFESLDLTAFDPPSPVSDAAHAAFDYSGGRWRGLRETDRVPDVLHPLAVPEKLTLASIGLPLPILGLAESRALAEAPLAGTDNCGWSLVCRRIRIAFAVPLSRDTDSLPYDYDSRALYMAQWFKPDAGLLAAEFQPIVGPLTDQRFGPCPVDTLFDKHSRRLYVAEDGENGSHASEVYVFQVNLPRA